MTSPVFNPITPAIYRQRLTIQACALIGAQAMYLALALLMLKTGFRPPGASSSQQSWTVGLFVFGLVCTIASFPAARIAGRQPLPPDDFLKVAIGLGRQFLIGFAFAEFTAIAGLTVFFLYADIQVLVFLLCTAAAAIGIHYLRVRGKLDEIVRTQS